MVVLFKNYCLAVFNFFPIIDFSTKDMHRPARVTVGSKMLLFNLTHHIRMRRLKPLSPHQHRHVINTNVNTHNDA